VCAVCRINAKRRQIWERSDIACDGGIQVSCQTILSDNRGVSQTCRLILRAIRGFLLGGFCRKGEEALLGNGVVDKVMGNGVVRREAEILGAVV